LRLLEKGVDILIATPGRLWDLIQSKEVPAL
jgi:superfamily II DNA/RNA helicase